MNRSYERSPKDLRPIRITRALQRDPLGSVLIEWGETKVICSVNVEEKVPHWMSGEQQGWITAEYGMLPGCSDKRIHRDRIRQTGRTHEIQRLIGRSIRAAVPDMKSLGQRTFQIDCDVLQADGGTRVASITGSCLAFHLALQKLVEKRLLQSFPKISLVAAVSLGRVKGESLLDLDYQEDFSADVDANIVMNEQGQLIEIQGTAEKATFSRQDWNELMDYAEIGCRQLFSLQKKVLSEWGLSA